MEGLPPAALSLLPNPLTPMAFLPPDVARQVTIAYYILVAALVIMLWDMLNNIAGDWKLAKHGFSTPLATYFLARISMLAFLLGITITQTAPIGACEQGELAVRSLFPVQVSLTSLLFFFRVRAMYHDNKWAIGFFFVMWMGVSGASVTEVFYPIINLGPTDYCIGTSLPKFVVVSCILPLVNDTFVFLAISWKLAGTWNSSMTTGGKRSWIRTVMLGKYLPSFSKAMLRDGQVYYLSVISLYLIYLIVFYIKAVPDVIRGTLGIPCAAVVNIMACRVYRNTKSGLYRETTTVPSLPTLRWERNGAQASSETPTVILKTFEQQVSMDTIDISPSPQVRWSLHHQPLGEKVDEDAQRIWSAR